MKYHAQLPQELQQLMALGFTEIPNMRREIDELRKLRAEVQEVRKMLRMRLTRQQVCERLGVHRNTLASYIRDGRFPPPSRDGRWSLTDVLEWERVRMGER